MKFVVEKQSLDVHVNGQVMEAENVFVDDGTEMRFDLGSSKALIKATCCDKKQGVMHQLFIDGTLIEEDTFS